MEKCVAQTRANKSCSNYPIANSKFCQRHDPKLRLARREACRQGILTRGNKLSSKYWNKEHRQAVSPKRPKTHKFEYDSNIASTFIKLIRNEVRQAIMEIFFPKGKL